MAVLELIVKTHRDPFASDFQVMGIKFDYHHAWPLIRQSLPPFVRGLLN